MNEKTTELAREQAVADHIKKRLAEIGIDVHVTAQHQCAEIVSKNAHPDQQRVIDRMAKEHQTARTHPQTDSWSHENVRDDIPQTRWVFHYPRFTREFKERIEAVVDELAPHTQTLDVDLLGALFQGTQTEFWTKELGGPQPYRCMLCGKPIDDVNYLRAPWNQTGKPMRHADC